MKLFRRERHDAASAPKSDYAAALQRYDEIARTHGFQRAYVDVVSEFGGRMQSHAGGIGPFSTSELPFPKALICAALYVAYVDPRAAAAREEVLTGILDLERYLDDAEIAPYRAAIAARDFQLSTLASEALGQLLAADPRAGAQAIAGVPEPDTDALTALDRLERRRRAMRWMDLLEKLPSAFDTNDRSDIFLRWMHEQAAETLAISKSACRDLEELSERGREAAEAFGRDLAALRALVNEADAFPAPPTLEDRAVWYHSVVVHVVESLSKISVAVASGRREDVAAPKATLVQMQTLLQSLAEAHEVTRAELVRRAVARQASAGGPAMPTAERDFRPRTAEPPSDQKGFIEDFDGDGSPG